MTSHKHTDTSRSGDLVERLRRNSGWRNGNWQCVTDPALLTEAADQLEALQQRVRELEDSLSFIAKWVERGLFCKTTSPQDAISLIAHYPGMPWHSQRWDVDHKPYAEAFYKTFPNAKGDTHD